MGLSGFQNQIPDEVPCPSSQAASGSKVNGLGVSFVSGPRRQLMVGGQDPFSLLFSGCLHLALALPFLQQLRAHALPWLGLAEPWLQGFR